MIFVTIGTQLPFDRLIRAIDDVAPQISARIIAQIGKGAKYTPKNFEYHEFVEPAAFDNLFKQASLIVSHAGIGTVLTAQKHGKPIVLFPRLASLGEHRNDHQLATALQLRGRPGIHVALDANELNKLLMAQPKGAPVEEGASRERLISFLAKYIQNA